MSDKKYPRKIVAIGGSTVHGEGDVIGGGFIGKFRRWYEATYEASQVYNLGVSGDSTKKIIDRISDEVPRRRPELILVQTSVNDCARKESRENPPITPLYDFRENIQTIIDKTKDIAPVIFIGVFPVDDARTCPVSWGEVYYLLYDVIEYERNTHEICEQNNIPYISVMSDWLKVDYKKYLYKDGLHANSKGHDEIFRRIKSLLLQDYL